MQRHTLGLVQQRVNIRCHFCVPVMILHRNHKFCDLLCALVNVFHGDMALQQEVHSWHQKRKVVEKLCRQDVSRARKAVVQQPRLPFRCHSESTKLQRSRSSVEACMWPLAKEATAHFCKCCPTRSASTVLAKWSDWMTWTLGFHLCSQLLWILVFRSWTFSAADCKMHHPRCQIRRCCWLALKCSFTWRAAPLQFCLKETGQLLSQRKTGKKISICHQPAAVMLLATSACHHVTLWQTSSTLLPAAFHRL